MKFHRMEEIINSIKWKMAAIVHRKKKHTAFEKLH